MFQRNKQTLGKEKARTRKIKETKKNNVFQKVVDGQKEKWKFERDDKRKTNKENRIGRKNDFKDRPFGGTK